MRRKSERWVSGVAGTTSDGANALLGFADRESLKNTCSEDEYYAPILERSVICASSEVGWSDKLMRLFRYIKDEAQSEAAKATRGGQHLP
jgi:hypothetical protein